MAATGESFRAAAGALQLAWVDPVGDAEIPLRVEVDAEDALAVVEREAGRKVDRHGRLTCPPLGVG